MKMRCCENCFEGRTLKEYINLNGKIHKCDLCGTKGVNCIEPYRLYDLFKPPLELFTNVRKDGKPLPELFDREYWPIFNDPPPDKNKRAKFWQELFADPNRKNRGKKTLDPFASWIVKPSLSPSRLWQELSIYLKTKRRFSVDYKRFNRIFDYLRHPPDDMIYSFPMGRPVFYRARIADENAKVFECKDMGPPPPSKASAGRANPLGIPYLYLADRIETAIAEVRPWTDAKVYVANFKTNRLIRVLINLGKPASLDPFAVTQNPIKRWVLNDLMGILTTELSKPVDPRKSHLDYLPSQFLVEFIRNENESKPPLDGVMWPSSANPGGSNIVLFDKNIVSCIGTKATTVFGVETKFDPISF